MTNRAATAPPAPGSSNSAAFASAAINADAAINRAGGQISASDNRLEANAPTTKPSCTALVSQADCPALKDHAAVNSGITAVAENQVVSVSTTPRPARARARARRRSVGVFALVCAGRSVMVDALHVTAHRFTEAPRDDLAARPAALDRSGLRAGPLIRRPGARQVARRCCWKRAVRC